MVKSPLHVGKSPSLFIFLSKVTIKQTRWPLQHLVSGPAHHVMHCNYIIIPTWNTAANQKPVPCAH